MSNFRKNNNPINDPGLEKVKNSAVLIKPGILNQYFSLFYFALTISASLYKLDK